MEDFCHEIQILLDMYWQLLLMLRPEMCNRQFRICYHIGHVSCVFIGQLRIKKTHFTSIYIRENILLKSHFSVVFSVNWRSVKLSIFPSSPYSSSFPFSTTENTSQLYLDSKMFLIEERFTSTSTPLISSKSETLTVNRGG